MSGQQAHYDGQAIATQVAMPALARALVTRRPEDQLLMWAGFFASLLGAMTCSIGSAAAREVAERIRDLAQESIEPPEVH